MTYKIPEHLNTFISRALENEGLTLSDSTVIAKSIKQLSDFYIQNPKSPTPWNEKFARVAYLCYFLPLNFLRIQRVADHCNDRGFFNNIEHLVDFGAGLATATSSLHPYLHQLKKRSLIETSSKPAEMIQNLWPEIENTSAPIVWHKNYTENLMNQPAKSLCVFSYSLTELTQIPDWALNSEALLIIEPATQEDGRRVLEWRKDLLESHNYHAYAPCTHQQACPLLTESKTDWCHDRVHVEMPNWFQKIEEHLPIKNKTLTVTYLAVRKTQPSELSQGTARLTGDLLKENGKDRQLICRGPKREFLAWMHRHGEHSEYKRGDLTTVDASYEVRSNELRVPKESFKK